MARVLTVKARLEWQTEEIQRGIREADSGEFASDDEISAVFSKWELPASFPSSSKKGITLRRRR
jgi:predicted transcriptional regulator